MGLGGIYSKTAAALSRNRIKRSSGKAEKDGEHSEHAAHHESMDMGLMKERYGDRDGLRADRGS